MPFPLVSQSTPPEEAFRLFLQFVLNTGLRKLTLIASEANPTVLTPHSLEEGAQLQRRREPNLRRWIGIRDTYQKARTYVTSINTCSKWRCFEQRSFIVTNNLNPSSLATTAEMNDGSSSEDDSITSEERKRRRSLLTPVDEPALKKFLSSDGADLMNIDVHDDVGGDASTVVEEEEDDDEVRISMITHSTAATPVNYNRFSRSERQGGSDPNSPVSPVTPSDHPPEPPKPEDPLWDVYQMQGLCLSGESAY